MAIQGEPSAGMTQALGGLGGWGQRQTPAEVP